MERYHLEDLGVDEIILKWILQKQVVHWTHLAQEKLLKKNDTNFSILISTKMQHLV
jgi:hypothetical protein